MKLILSPTKTMAVAPSGGHGQDTGEPDFFPQALALNQRLAALSSDGLKKLFNTSETLTLKAMEQIRQFETAPAGPAIFAFRGEAFKALDPESLTREALVFAQSHLRICSGLYGLLRPLDGIRPYRLDLATPLRVDGQGLTAFWKPWVVPWLAEQMALDEPLLNLASEEYAALFRGSVLADRMITLSFKEKADSTLKINSVRAKQARGLFARAVIQGRIQAPDDLKDVSIQGYEYSTPLSDSREWVFLCRS